ncbi:MAG: S8 family serine peptidase [Acidobacteriia bacterium]|nr:S8 family serine peptidase [Terriglobia bacterium]
MTAQGLSRPDAAPQTGASPWLGTGQGVSIAVIDSGINPKHSHVGRVEGGIAIRLGEDGVVIFEDDWNDALGHGTAIAGVLRAKAPGALLYSVRIFHQRLQASPAAAAAAIRWAADHGAKIINCSLSTPEAQHRALFQAACDHAAARGACIVAASLPGHFGLLPASLPGVIAVAADPACSWDEYRGGTAGPSGEPLFLAHPSPRPLPGRPQEKNLQGASFAAAHIAAWAARIREQAPMADAAAIARILVAHEAAGAVPSSSGGLQSS